VSVGGASTAAAAAPAAAAVADEDDDEELDLFGAETEEEKEAKAKVIATAKARGAEKAKLSKSMIILDLKPWDDETDMAAMEAYVRSFEKEGLLWGASKLVPVGYGIKKLQITVIIEDFKVPSFGAPSPAFAAPQRHSHPLALPPSDEIIEDHLVQDGENAYIQSADIASFNKL